MELLFDGEKMIWLGGKKNKGYPAHSLLVLCPPLLPHPLLGLTKRVAFTCLVVADREQRRRPRPHVHITQLTNKKKQRRWDSRRRDHEAIHQH